MLTRFLLACLFVAPAGACAAREAPVTTPDFETRLVLKNAAGSETGEFRRGEPITFVVIIRNRADGPRTLTLPTSQTHECLVSGADRREVWRLSSGRMFAQVITEIILPPGESRSFRATWDQVDSRGRSVAPGEYEGVGLVPGRVPGCRSDVVRFTIRPGGVAKPD